MATINWNGDLSKVILSGAGSDSYCKPIFPNNYALLRATGTTITLKYYNGSSWFSNNGLFKIDNTEHRVNINSGNGTYTVTGLDNTEHIILLHADKKTAGRPQDGTRVLNFTQFITDGEFLALDTPYQVLNNPSVGYQRIKEFQSFKTNGDWLIGETIISSNINDSFSFRFTGGKLKLLCTSDLRSSNNIEILINGVSNIISPFKFVTGENKNSVIYEIEGLTEEISTCVITNLDNAKLEICAIDIEEGAVILPELSKDYEFPVKTIEKADVEAYAASCINTEEQLLIAIEDGSIYLTKGDGTYIECSSSGGTITPPIETHVHDNKPVIDSLNDSAGMLSYKGKVVVNNSEYSFKTLPRRKAPTNTKEINSTKGGRLPWQQ